jgi:bifunctional polynucleotide phosphatase/kinase
MAAEEPSTKPLITKVSKAKTRKRKKGKKPRLVIVDNLSDIDVFSLNDFRYRKKIAAFDYDHTLVKPKSKSTFNKNVDDWMWLRPNIPDIVRDFYEKGYGIVIFTNQSKRFKREQIEIAMAELGVPCKVFIAFKKKYKKPDPFLFNLYKRDGFDFERSFFVGDALGREGDWSDSDRDFAINCGLKYFSPEEIFPFGEKEEKAIDVKELGDQEVVVMMGYPGSGKSTYAEKYFGDAEGYAVLHRDDLKTEAKVKKEVRRHLGEGNSVVVDATHPSVEKRKTFVDIAKEHDVPIRIVHMTTSIEESMERNVGRDRKVPKIVFYVYRKKFEPPSKEEGFEDIIEV